MWRHKLANMNFRLDHDSHRIQRTLVAALCAGAVVAQRRTLVGQSGIDAEIDILDLNVATGDAAIKEFTRVAGGTLLMMEGSGIGDELFFLPDASGSFSSGATSPILLRDINPGLNDGLRADFDDIFPSPDGSIAVVRCIQDPQGNTGSWCVFNATDRSLSILGEDALGEGPIPTEGPGNPPPQNPIVWPSNDVACLGGGSSGILCWDQRLPSGQQLFQLVGSSFMSLVAGDNFVCASTDTGAGRELHCADLSTPSIDTRLEQVFDANPGPGHGSYGTAPQEYFLSEDIKTVCGGYQNVTGSAADNTYMFCYTPDNGTLVQSTSRRHTSQLPVRSTGVCSGNFVFYNALDEHLGKARLTAMDMSTGATKLPTQLPVTTPSEDEWVLTIKRGPQGIAIAWIVVSSTNSIFVWNGDASAAVQTPSSFVMMHDYDAFLLDSHTAVLPGRDADSNLAFLHIDTSISGTANPQITVLPDISGPPRTIAAFQPFGAVNGQSAGFVALVSVRTGSGTLEPTIWRGDAAQAPEVLQQDLGGSSRVIFPRFLADPDPGVTVGEDVSVVFLKEVQGSLGEVFAVVEQGPPLTYGGATRSIFTLNSTAASNPSLYTVASGADCAVMDYRYDMRGTQVGCFDKASGAFVLAQDMPAHPLEAQLGFNTAPYHPDMSTDKLDSVIDVNGTLAGMLLLVETATYGSELFYWDFEHRPFMIADLNPGTGSSGFVNSNGGGAAVLGERYLCFAASPNQTFGEEPAIFDLHDGAVRLLNMAPADNEGSDPDTFIAISDDVCVMSLDATGVIQNVVGTRMFSLEASDPAATAEVISNMTPLAESLVVVQGALADMYSVSLGGGVIVASDDSQSAALLSFEADVGGTLSMGASLDPPSLISFNDEVITRTHDGVFLYSIDPTTYRGTFRQYSKNGTVLISEEPADQLYPGDGLQLLVGLMASVQPNGSVHAIGNSMSLSGDTIGQGRWDMATGHLIHRFNYSGPVVEPVDIQEVEPGVVCMLSARPTRFMCTQPGSTQFLEAPQLPDLTSSSKRTFVGRKIAVPMRTGEEGLMTTVYADTMLGRELARVHIIPPGPSPSPTPSSSPSPSVSPSPSPSPSVSSSPSPSSSVSPSPSPSTTTSPSTSPTPTVAQSTSAPSPNASPSGAVVSPSPIPRVPRVRGQRGKAGAQVESCTEPTSALTSDSGGVAFVLHVQVEVASSSCSNAEALIQALAAAAGVDADDIVSWYEHEQDGNAVLVLQTPALTEADAERVMRSYEEVLDSPVLQDTLGSGAEFSRETQGSVLVAPNPYAEAETDGDDGVGVVLIVAIVAAVVVLAGSVFFIWWCGVCSASSTGAQKQASESSAADVGLAGSSSGSKGVKSRMATAV